MIHCWARGRAGVRSTGCGKSRSDGQREALGPEVQLSTMTELGLDLVIASTMSSASS